MSFFFFSSRRRHTRYWRDWSSDVCSSDLGTFYTIESLAPAFRAVSHANPFFYVISGFRSGFLGVADSPVAFGALLLLAINLRSEERRVGKECRSRWSPYH